MAEKETKIKKPRKKKNYLNNADLLEETIKSQEQDAMTDKLAKMLMVLCDRYRANSTFRFANFTQYTYFEDMKSFALVNLLTAFRKFDADRFSNAFAFYTQCVHNSYLQYLNQEKRHRNIRDSLLLDQGLNPSFKFLEDYEKAEAEKKAKMGMSDNVYDKSEKTEPDVETNKLYE